MSLTLKTVWLRNESHDGVILSELRYKASPLLVGSAYKEENQKIVMIIYLLDSREDFMNDIHVVEFSRCTFECLCE